MFSLRNKKNINTFVLKKKKKILSRAMILDLFTFDPHATSDPGPQVSGISKHLVFMQTL